MDAKEARQMTQNHIATKRAAEIQQKQFDEDDINEQFNKKFQAEIACWEYFIGREIRSGNTFMQISYPDSEQMYQFLKKHFEDKGFRVAEYTEDGGYCIGDISMVQVDW